MTSFRIRSLLKRYLFDAEILRLMGLVVMVKPLGLVTQMLIAKYYGAGPHYDAYSLALFIVGFSATVLGNVYTGTAIPYIIKLRATLDSKCLLGFQNGIMLLFLLPALVITLVMLVAPGMIIDLVGSELPKETHDYSTQMVRLMTVPGLLLLFGLMGKATLNLNRSYQLVAGMPVLNAAIMLVFLVIFHRWLGIWSLVLGFGISQLLQVVCLWWLTLRKRIASWTRPNFPPGTLRKLWSLSWMLMFSQAIILAYQFIDKLFAVALEPGSISSIAYADTIVLFGVQLFTLTQVTVMFTRISEFISNDDVQGSSDYILDNLGRVSRLAIPVALSICLASEEIVCVLFQRGEFTAAAAERTSGALAIYILGLLGFVLTQIAARVFHAMQRMGARIWLALQLLVTKIVLSVLLVNSYEVVGLAISSTIAIYAHVVFSFWVLHRYRVGLQVDRWAKVLLEHHLIALITYLIFVSTGFKKLVADWSIKGTLTGDVAIAAAKTGFVFAVYFALFFIWRVLSKRIRAD
jgi:putative peptidoglycan lipid II flippase